MLKMSFNDKWIHWISMHVESIDYFVLINYELVGPVIVGQGLRQGDPLSLYLFIICVEGVSSYIRDADDRGVINGTLVCRGSPIVSHLIFANDCFLFFEFEVNQAHIMKDILITYKEASGQAISLPKSESYCS
jgi:hypothetical protein